MSRQILIAVDLKASFAVTLIRYAQGFAATMGDEFRVLYVMEQASGGLFGFRSAQAPEPTPQAELDKATAEWLTKINAQLDTPLIADQLSVKEGVIAETINDAIDTLNVELLIIGAESRTSLAQIFDAGRGTNRITRTATCDVLVVGKRHLGLA